MILISFLESEMIQQYMKQLHELYPKYDWDIGSFVEYAKFKLKLVNIKETVSLMTYLLITKKMDLFDHIVTKYCDMFCHSYTSCADIPFLCPSNTISSSQRYSIHKLCC